MKKNLLWCGVLVGALVFGGLALAQKPVENIDPNKHPNLASGQQHIIQAYQRIDDARTANKEELGGHAEKALQLLVQADHELKLGAEYADHRK
jgi:hypothetical protein